MQSFSEETLIQEQQKAEDMLQAASAGIGPSATPQERAQSNAATTAGQSNTARVL